MMRLVGDNKFVSNSINEVRNQEEQIFAACGDENYSALSVLMNYDIVDNFAEDLGDYVGNFVRQGLYDKQYFEKRYSKIKNFLTRNIYLDPVKKITMEKHREIVYVGSRVLVELLLKGGARIITKTKYDKEKYKIYSDVYSFLDLFSREDQEQSNSDLTNREMSKILNSFDITRNKRDKLLGEVRERGVESLDKYEGNYVLTADAEIKKNISYLLYSLSCTKYMDEALADVRVLEYYRYLGYGEKYANEMLRENKNSFVQIADHQHKMVVIASQMVQNVFIDFPFIDLKSISERGKELAKYDPYAIRRKKVQRGLSNAATTGKKIAFEKLIEKYPELCVLAASEAFAQLPLSDNIKEEGRNKMKKLFRDEKMAEKIVENTETIQKKSME